jgi:hypothetical protein
MPEPAATAERKKRTVDMGVATIVAAIITACGAIITAALATLVPHPSAGSPVPVPTVTVTKYAAGPSTSPAPVVTITVHTAGPATAFGHGTIGWTWAAGAITAVLAAITITTGGTVLLRRRWLASELEADQDTAGTSRA